MLLLSACAVVFAAVVVACGGSSDETTVRQDGPGTLVLSRPDGIYEIDVATGVEKPIITTEIPNSFLFDPAVSPDGSMIAYIVQPPAVIVDGLYDAGSDLWIADRDGANPRLIHEHQEKNALVRYPQWVGDGHVAAIIQEITLIETELGPTITGVDYTVQSVDIETSERVRLLDDAIAYTLSPDGGRIIYARLDPLLGEIFESRELPDGQPVELVAKSENLQPFNSPRFSPDGQVIAFASAEQVATPVPTSGRLAMLRPLGAPLAAEEAAPRADGLPQDIWLLDADGGKPRLLADLKEDLPSIAWSGNGEHLFVLGGNGLYDVTLESGAATRIGEGSFHGQVDWTP